MWFKNVRVYRLSAPLTIDAAALEQALAEYKFTPCSGREALRSGFSFPLHPSIKHYSHQQNQRWYFAIKRQEKVLPAAVINEELAPKLDAAATEAGRPLSRKEKQALKEDLIQTLLPRAFSRSSLTQGYYDGERQWLVLNTGSASKAEDILALLRKALGSLPALPWLDSHKLNQQLQLWLQQQSLPAQFQLGAAVELKAPDEEGAKVKFSNHLLTADEVQTHLQDKLVTRLSLQQEQGLALTVADDGGIKQIQYPDALFEQNEELGWDDLISRLDADLILMADSLDQALQAISAQVNGSH